MAIEIVKSYEKFVPEADRPKQADDKPAGATSLLADGSEPVDQIFAKAQCVFVSYHPWYSWRHGHNWSEARRGDNGPAAYLKDPTYKGTAKSAAEYIMESIVDPSAYVVKPFPDKTMPAIFGQKLSAGALKKIVDYLSQVKTGAPPPKVS